MPTEAAEVILGIKKAGPRMGSLHKCPVLDLMVLR